MCLFYQNYWVHKLTSEKHLLACKGDLVRRYSWKNLGHNWASTTFGMGKRNVNAWDDTFFQK